MMSKNLFEEAEAAKKRAGSADRHSAAKIFENLGEVPERRQRFLLVDNEESVVYDWNTTLGMQSVLGLHADFHIFRFLEPGEVSNVKGITAGNIDDLIALIRDQLSQGRAFDGFFIDGNLGAGAKGRDGLDLIRHLRDTIDEIRFAPYALVTVSVDNIDFRKQAADIDVVRYMPKFSYKDSSLLPRMILEFDEMHVQARQAAWVALNQEVAQNLEAGKSAVEAGEIAKRFLMSHMGIESLYFRVGGNGVLRAFVMHDRFDAGQNLEIADAPLFYQEFTDPSALAHTKNWLSIESLGQNEVGASWLSGMGKWRALLARVGDPVDHEGGVFAIYAPPNRAPFRPLEGPSLHHLVVQLSNRRAREREREKLRTRQQRLTDLLEVFTRPNSSKEVGEPLAKFLYEEFGRGSGAKTKATVRRFERGSGNLIRIGGPEGDLVPTRLIDKIDINDSRSVYARVARTKKSALYSNVGEHPDGLIFTNIDVKSSLTVPLSFEGACFGAANLESDRRDAFSGEDQRLAGELAEAATAAIERHRSLRFLEEAAELLDAIAEAPHGADATTLLIRSVKCLYTFCGFSDLLIALPSAQEGMPWEVVEAFRGEDDNVFPANDRLLQQWRERIRARWPETHLCRALSQRDEFVFDNTPDQVDNDVAVRPGRPTLSQATLKIATPGATKPEAMLALLFEHEHPFSSKQEERLNAFGQFMGRLFLTQGRAQTMMSQLSVQSREVWLGRMSLSYQHYFMNGLWTMSGWLEAVKNNVATPGEALTKIGEMIAQLAPVADRSHLVKGVTLEPVATSEVWEAVRSDVTASAKLAWVTLDPAPAGLPELQADRVFLRVIFFTLFDNALRYAGPMTTISVTASDRGLIITDNGKGLSPEIKARLFEPGNTTGHTSTGQGLYIARLMAREMGGDLVYLESESGTVFELCLKRN
jgi:signal transduction histidine kinase